MKNDFWQKIKDIFLEQQVVSETVPVIHEIIERSKKEKSEYDQWIRSKEKERIKEWLNHEFDQWLLSSNNKIRGINFLKTPSSNGFVVFYDQLNYSQKGILYFFDYCKQKVLDLNYKASLSDLRTFNKAKYVETIQRHYLKPRIKLILEEKSNQLFGNVNIELISRDGKYHQMKFSATTYNDKKYEEGRSFEELMKELLC